MSTLSIPSQRKKQLKKLARLMNKQNEMMIPPIAPVLELLEYDVTDEEIDFLIRLGTKARTIHEIATLFNMDQEECASKIEQFVKRGFIWGEVGALDSEKVELAPIVVGWLELQLLGDQTDEKSQEFANRLENLFMEAKKLNFFPVRGISNLLTPMFTKHCPTNVISLIDDKPVIQENICIGCGQCALQCPTNSFTMKPMNRDVLVPMVKNSEARIQ